MFVFPAIKIVKNQPWKERRIDPLLRYDLILANLFSLGLSGGHPGAVQLIVVEEKPFSSLLLDAPAPTAAA
jgi:hypothetical protein